MNIAIVDDDALDLETAADYLEEHIRSAYPEATVQIDAFPGGEALLESFRFGKYDLIVLDIYMKGISGMETARAIRRKDNEVRIVFLTSSDEHLLEGYRVFAVGYFIKPLTEHREEFSETLAHIFPALMERSKEIALPVRGMEVKVPYRDIFYVEVGEKRKLFFHLSGQKILATSMPYEECCGILLADGRFLECHHRIIVNLDCVEDMGQDDFVLKDGTHIPISRRKRQAVKIAYMDHFLQR